MRAGSRAEGGQQPTRGGDVRAESMDESRARRRGEVERAAGVLLTPRDYAGIGLCARLGAVRADDLAGWLAWHNGREQIAARTAAEVVARWQRLGLVTGRRIDAGQPRAWAATALGARLVGWPGATGLPSLAEHRHTVTTAALAVGYLRNGYGWTAERELGHVAGHRPDGIVTAPDGRRQAVEVEITRKGRTRWAGILAGLLDAHERVAYWTTPEVGRALSAVLPEIVTTEDLPRVAVLDLGGWLR